MNEHVEMLGITHKLRNVISFVTLNVSMMRNALRFLPIDPKHEIHSYFDGIEKVVLKDVADICRQIEHISYQGIDFRYQENEFYNKIQEQKKEFNDNLQEQKKEFNDKLRAKDIEIEKIAAGLDLLLARMRDLLEPTE